MDDNMVDMYAEFDWMMAGLRLTRLVLLITSLLDTGSHLSYKRGLSAVTSKVRQVRASVVSHAIDKTLHLVTVREGWGGFNLIQRLTEQLGNPRIWANVRHVLKSTVETM
jgi:hypothetical protein